MGSPPQWRVIHLQYHSIYKKYILLFSIKVGEKLRDFWIFRYKFSLRIYFLPYFVRVSCWFQNSLLCWLIVGYCHFYLFCLWLFDKIRPYLWLLSAIWAPIVSYSLYILMYIYSYLHCYRFFLYSVLLGEKRSDHNACL